MSSAVQQTAFDFESLLGTYRSRALIRVPEVARMIGRSCGFVEAEMDRGAILAHSLPGRKRTERSTPPRCLAVWIAKTADYPPEEYAASVRDLFSTWTPEQRRWAVKILIAMGDSK